MRRLLPALLGFFAIFLTTTFIFRTETKNVSAALATHLVISEVQIAGVASGNDFIELYNPTSSDVSLEGLRLGKRSSTGTTSASIVAFAADETVPARGYYLWCNTTLNVALSCDRNTSATVSNNNSVALIDGALNGGAIVDAVTFGSPASPLGEGTSLTAPIASSSVERKANSSSDATSMGLGGTDEFAGNGEDTNDNASDFVSRSTPQPQNSQSSVEPEEVTPTVTPTESPTPTVSPTPTEEPSATPTPTEEPSPTITPTESPTPTLEPTATPTFTPTPTTKAPKIIAKGPIFTCTLEQKSFRFFGKTFFFPSIHCFRTT